MTAQRRLELGREPETLVQPIYGGQAVAEGQDERRSAAAGSHLAN